jgi:tetratricopeptide (TPR) repeat protein
MIRLFSKTAFQLVKNSSRLPPKSPSLTKFYPQFFSFSTYKAINWEQNFPYKSIVNETTFQKALPALKNASKEQLLKFQKIFNDYAAHKDPSLLSEVDAKNLAMVVWKMGSLAQSARNAEESEAYYLEALDITKKSKAHNPNTVIMIQNNLGWLYYNMDQLDKSLICLEDVCNMIEEIPDFVDFDSVRVRNLYFTSKVLTRQGKQDQAIELLNKMITAIDNDPHAPPTYMTTSAFNDLGQIYHEKEDIEQALGVWEEGIRYSQQIYGEDPDGLQDLYRSIADTYLTQENDAMVVEYMKKCIEISKKYDKVNFNDFYTLAFAQFQQKDHEGFLQSAQTFIDLTGSGLELERKSSLYQMMCITHYMHNNITLAEKSFSSLVTIASTLYGGDSLEVVELYMERVELLSGQETTKSYYRAALAQAIHVSKNCENLHPTRRINLLLRAGESFANDEEWSQALEYLEKLHKLSPEKYLAEEVDQLEYVYLLTAKTYCFLGRFQEGLVYAEKAKALCEASGDPNNRMADLDESIKHIHDSMKNA